MFQDGQLFSHLTVARNVGYALRLRRAPRTAERVEELLALVGLEGYGARLPDPLRRRAQRIALARSLAVGPRLILLDEPLSALDAGLRERLAGDLREILRAAGTTALMVTHDHEEAFAVADRLAVMRDGRVVQQGVIGDVWRPADPGRRFPGVRPGPPRRLGVLLLRAARRRRTPPRSPYAAPRCRCRRTGSSRAA